MVFLDPNSEIVRQLTRIADAANAPHPSPWAEWLKIVISFVLGIVTAYIGDWVRNRSSDSKEQLKLRRIVYYELARCFLDLHGMISSAKPHPRVRFTVLKSLSPFDGQTYIKQTPAVFYALPEGEVLNSMYHQFGSVCRVDPEHPKTFGLVEMKSPLGYFADCYRNDRRLRKYFKKILSPPLFSAIEGAVPLYRWSFTFEEMIDSGMMEVVERVKE